MSERLERLGEAIEARFGSTVTRIASTVGQLTYEVAAADLIATLTALRDESEFAIDMLMDVCGVDYLTYGDVEWTTDSATNSGFNRGVVRGEGEGGNVAAGRRYAVVYNLQSTVHNTRVRIRSFCDDDDAPIMPSVTGVWASANWFEREAFDLFGVLFDGHPDLRRLLTDYGFIGHPFRKDFPLIGNVEVRYDPERGRVVYQPVSIEPRTLVPRVIRDDNRYDPALKESSADG